MTDPGLAAASTWYSCQKEDLSDLCFEVLQGSRSHLGREEKEIESYAGMILCLRLRALCHMGRRFFSQPRYTALSSLFPRNKATEMAL